MANPENVFKEHVIVEIIHTARDNSYETNEGGVEYENTFTAIPATPHRLTHRPKIEGTQVALVAGPEGEEIHPDQYGRIKLWFPWDRRAKKDGSDTCWVRVAQSWAGAGFGGQIIPRIGMEVMVTHLDGDPDRPLVTGVVPNSRQKVPYKLPENKTKSVFRSNTHKSKDKWQMNELTFEDKEGEEEVFIHAQKDMTVKVLNHSTERVDSNKVLSIGGAALSEIQLSSVHNIGQNLTTNVGTGPAGDLVRGALTQSAFGIRQAGYFVSDMMPLMTGAGNYTLNAAASISLHALGSSIQNTAGASMISVGLDQIQSVGGTFRIAAGSDFNAVVGKKTMWESHDEIHLRCGKSEIIMKPDGTVTIKGTSLIVEEKELAKVTAKKIEGADIDSEKRLFLSDGYGTSAQSVARKYTN
jgi:type VI secretion system secreted protein VgrG